MKILVINCGSSSLKYQILDMTNETLLCKGLVEKIGIEGSVINHEKIGQEKFVLQTPMKDHKDAIAQVLAAIQDPDHGVVTSMSEIGAVGHRVVHGGEHYADSVLIDDEVMKVIEECSDLAPLHNPPNIAGIEACKALMPDTPMVAVFDTAFHQTMPPESYIYALPYEYYTKYGIRRYGSASIPMDEALGTCSLDISGRAFLVFDCKFADEFCGTMDTQLLTHNMPSWKRSIRIRHQARKVHRHFHGIHTP